MRRLLLLAALGLPAACVAPPGDAPRTVVFFAASSAALEDGAPDVIRDAAERARVNPGLPVRVLGFAAPQAGVGDTNRTLAQARAQAVRDALEQAGVAPARLSIGTRVPVPFEQQPNESRRVEISFER